MEYRSILQQRFQLHPDTIERIESHFGTEICRVRAGECVYLLKSVPSYMEGARREGALTAWLRDREIPTARFLRTTDGAYFWAQDDHILTIQTWEPGDTIPYGQATESVIQQAAASLGAILSVMPAYPGLPLHFDPAFFSPQQACTCRDQLHKEYLERQAQLTATEDERYQQQLRHLDRICAFAINPDSLTYGAAHGDFHSGQLLLDSQTGRITIIDWASACRMPVCLELLSSFVSLAPACETGEIPGSALSKYIRKVRFPLTPVDIQQMPYVYFFWQTLCNYHPAEEIPVPYQPVAQRIAKVLDWLDDHVDRLSLELKNIFSEDPA